MDKCFKSRLFLLFLILPFFNPTSLKYIPSLVTLYNIVQAWKLVSIFIIIFIYFSRNKLSSIIGVIILFESVAIAASLANGVHNSKTITNALLDVGFAMLTELAITTDFEKFRRVMFNVLFVAATINLILCTIFSQGLKMAALYKNWTNPLYFLGIDNGMIKVLLPLLVLAYYLKFCVNKSENITNHQKIKDNAMFIITNVICILTLVIIDSSTGLTVGVLFIVMMILFTGIWKVKYPRKAMITIYVVFLIAVVFLGYNMSFINNFTSIFGKSATFTGRSELWTQAIEMIFEKPLIGYGYTGGNIEIWGGNYSSHNMFLELMIQGGILLFAIFMFLTLQAIKRLRTASVSYSNLVFMGIFSYMLIGLMEVGITFEYFMLIVMACYPDLMKAENVRIIKFYYGGGVK